MKHTSVLKKLVFVTGMLCVQVSNVWALDAARKDNSDLFVLLFLGFCALIVIAQLIPAVMMMLGLARGVKKEQLQVDPAWVDHQGADAGQEESMMTAPRENPLR